MPTACPDAERQKSGSLNPDYVLSSLLGDLLLELLGIGADQVELLVRELKSSARMCQGLFGARVDVGVALQAGVFELGCSSRVLAPLIVNPSAYRSRRICRINLTS